MIHDGRFAFFGEERSTAEHSVSCQWGRQYRLLPFPIHHIITGHVCEGSAVTLIDIVQVVFPFVVDGAIRIAGNRLFWTGVRQMIGQPGIGNRVRHGGRFEFEGRGGTSKHTERHQKNHDRQPLCIVHFLFLILL